jgi:hypothetical protein
MLAIASSLQLPLQVPWQVASHWPVQFTAALGAVHFPSQTPVQLAIPPAGVATPSHFPSQLPLHPPMMVPVHVPLHMPVQVASHTPWHWAATVTVPSQTALALHSVSH